MKKLLTTVALCLITMTASAQWKIDKADADELRGTPASTNLYYNSEECIFMYMQTSDMIAIMSKGKVFNVEHVGNYVGEEITVGLYDSNDTLLEKIVMWLDRQSSDYRFIHTRNAGVMFNPVGQKKKIKKIIEHLSKTNGYIRLIVPTFNSTDIDVKIPHISE